MMWIQQQGQKYREEKREEDIEKIDNVIEEKRWMEYLG